MAAVEVKAAARMSLMAVASMVAVTTVAVAVGFAISSRRASTVVVLLIGVVPLHAIAVVAVMRFAALGDGVYRVSRCRCLKWLRMSVWR